MKKSMRLTPGQEVALTVSAATLALALIAFFVYEYGGAGPNQPSTGATTTSTTTPTSALPNGQSASSSSLPPGCEKPHGGYLIVANEGGFNDSISHGAPTTPWPVITVKESSTVNITVCNADTQAHGFQVNRYFDSNIETVYPGQVIKVSFVANSPGTFEIYCSIFCSIHIYMQNGQLRVLSS